MFLNSTQIFTPSNSALSPEFYSLSDGYDEYDEYEKGSLNSFLFYWWLSFCYKSSSLDGLLSLCSAGYTGSAFSR